MITEQAEIKFWHWLKNKLSKSKVDMQRIENTTGGGVPDVNMCYQGSEAWIELKVYVKGNVLLRKQQYAWIVRRANVDGNVLVIAFNEETGSVDIWCPSIVNPLIVRPWGNTEKYVAIESSPDFSYNKNVSVDLYLRAIFNI